MSDLTNLIDDLVAANRILANEGVVDAYGHISVRHPDDPSRYLLSVSRSPELVEASDIIEFHLDSCPVKDDGRPKYIERPIHGSIYELRPDINSVVHNHAYDVLPFSITNVPFQPVIHPARGMRGTAAVWDIEDKFGGNTDLLVTNNDQGRDLAKKMGSSNVVLMRGHGCAVAASSIHEAVRTAIYTMINARILKEALLIGNGQIKPLQPGELSSGAVAPNGHNRAWEYLKSRADL